MISHIWGEQNCISVLPKKKQILDLTIENAELKDEIRNHSHYAETDGYEVGSPEDYEDKTDRLNHYDENVDLKEVSTNEEEFREWDGIDDDWEELDTQ